MGGNGVWEMGIAHPSRDIPNKGAFMGISAQDFPSFALVQKEFTRFWRRERMCLFCSVLRGNVCPVRAQRSTFLLTIPTSALDLPSHGEAI